MNLILPTSHRNIDQYYVTEKHIKEHVKDKLPVGTGNLSLTRHDQRKTSTTPLKWFPGGHFCLGTIKLWGYFLK